MTLQDLLEIEEIKLLKYAYMRCVDMKLWDEMATLFVPEATCSYSAGHYTHQGRETIVAWLRKGMDKPGFHSTHSVHQPEIRITGSDTAEGRWKLEDYVLDTDYDIVISGAAFYQDRYVKRDGRWLILHTGYERIFEQIEKRKDRPSLKVTASMWTTGGASSIKA